MLASLADAYTLMASSTSQNTSSQSSESSPQPLQSLQTAAPPPFLTKTYVMVDDPSTDAVVSWSHGHNSFIIWDPSEFSEKLLPRYFKHNNFASFVRQLNTYGFKKVDSDRWEFANEAFLRGQRHLLRNIHRKKPASQLQQIQAESSSSCMEVSNLGLEQEIGRLKHNKNVMMMEMGRLRQQQQVTNRELQSIGQRLHSTEQWQQQMMTFLAKAMKNPGLVAQLMHQTDSMQLEGAGRKRSAPSQGERSGEEEEPESASEGQLVKYASASKLDPFLRIEASSASFEALLQEIGLPLQQLSSEINSHESTSMQGVTEVQDDISNPIIHEIKSKDGTHFSSLVLPDVGGSDGPPSLGDSTFCKNDDNTDLMSLESGLTISNSVFGEEDSGTFLMEKMLEQLSVEIFWQ